MAGMIVARQARRGWRGPLVHLPNRRPFTIPIDSPHRALRVFDHDDAVVFEEPRRFSERAAGRLPFDYKRVPHERRSLLPGLHAFRRRGG